MAGSRAWGDGVKRLVGEVTQPGSPRAWGWGLLTPAPRLLPNSLPIMFSFKFKCLKLSLHLCLYSLTSASAWHVVGVPVYLLSSCEMTEIESKNRSPAAGGRKGGLSGGPTGGGQECSDSRLTGW